MAVYQFNLVDGVTRLLDPKGTELPDDDAALHYALKLARGFTWVRWSVHVIAEHGELVGCVDPHRNRTTDAERLSRPKSDNKYRDRQLA